MSPPQPRRMGDERLIAAFAGTGCPLCLEVDAAGRQYLRSVLYEQANDVGFRRRLLAGGGFCTRHTVLAEEVDRAESGGALATAILLQAVMRPRLAALGALKVHRHQPKRLTEALREAWDCVVCEHEQRAAVDATERSLEHASGDVTWHDWVTRGTYCLSHLRGLAVRAPDHGPALASELVEAQVGRLREIDQRLAAFQHHHGHDRRHELTDDERRSVADVRVALAGGGEGR